MFIARLFLRYAAQCKMSAALVFGDMRKAYYSVFIELVMGPLLTPGERQIVMSNSPMDELRQLSVISNIEAGHCLFADLPLPDDLFGVVREWQRLAWFVVDGSPTVFVHNIGVKPGDPAADVLFAFAFYCFHHKLLDLNLSGHSCQTRITVWP